MIVQANIQMMYTKLFVAVVNKEKFENDIKDVDLGYTSLVRIFGCEDGRGEPQEILFNPKHVQFIEYQEVEQ